MYQPESNTTSACWQLLVKPYPSHGTNKKQSLGNWLAERVSVINANFAWLQKVHWFLIKVD